MMRCFSQEAKTVKKEDQPCPPTTERRIKGLRGRCLQIFSVVAANIISISFGSVIGWSTAVASTIFNEYETDVVSWLVTITLPISPVGCILWGLITVRMGPRRSLLAISLPMTVGWILLLNTKNLWSTLPGRAVCGFGMGCIVNVLPVYVSDIAEVSLRGRLGAMMSVQVNLGILLTYIVGGVLDSMGVAIFGISIPVIFMAVFVFCPESPRYLFATGQESVAIETLRQLRESEEEVTAEIEAMRASRKETDSTTEFADLFRGKAARKSGIIALGVLTCQQICGISPVMYYAGAIFMSAGGNISPIIASCTMTTVMLAGSCMAASLMDKAGRRTLMLLSSSVMVVSQATLGYFMMPGTLAPSWTSIVSLSVYLLAYSLGTGPAPYVIVSELCVPRLKALACTVAIAYSCLLSFVVTKVFPDLANCLGQHGVFWLFAAGCATSVVFCLFCLPETANRSSESIQEQLEGKKHVKPEV